MSAAPYGWTPFVVLFLVGLVDRVEHQLMTGALPLIQAEWGISDTVAGSVATAGAVASLLIVIPAGYLSDRYPRTRIIGVVVVCWALITVGSGLAVGFAMFYAMRVLLSAAQEIDNPASGSLIADYYAPRLRPKVYGWTRVTAYLGGLGAMFAGIVGEALGWRAVFLIMAVPGLLVGLLCWWLREPVRGALDAMASESRDDRTDSTATSEAASPRFVDQVRRLLGTPTLVLASLGLCLVTAGIQGIYFWLPSMIHRTFEVGTGPAGTVTAAVSISGVLLGTLIGSWLGQRVHEVVAGGRIAVAGGGVMAGALVLAVALNQGDLLWFAVSLGVALTLISLAIPNNFATVAEVVGPDSRGLGFAFLQLLLTVGAALGPTVTGAVSDASGSLTAAFLALTAPIAVGGLLMFVARWPFAHDARLALRQPRQLED